MSGPKVPAKIPADLANYLEALLIIDNIEDAKELIANPDIIEDLEFHEADSDAESTSEAKME